MSRIGIFAFEARSGRQRICVCPITIGDHTWLTNCRLAAHGGDGVADWQASVHENVAEAKSALMSIYGIGWFNRARRQIVSIETGVA